MFCAEENLHHFINEIDKQISKLGITSNIDDLTTTVMCRTTLLQFDMVESALTKMEGANS